MLGIVYRKLGEINPYGSNPRKNKEAVKYVMESIRQFGFKVPIVIDSNGVIVTGHTRYEASKRLGLKEVPCIIADDLSEEQVRAFRLADNKVSEKAEWDFDLLDGEIELLDGFDLESLGFEFEDDEDKPKENQRARTGRMVNLDGFDDSRTEGFYQMPKIEAVNHIPKRLIGFNYMLTSKDTESGIHFYVDDYQFERIWSQPEKYIEKMRKFDCILTPDFSLYLDMPMAMKIWNVYRSRLIGQMAQDEGLTVIPTVSWAERETYSFCFDGLPEKATLSVSTVGVRKSKESISIFKDGLIELIERKKPRRLVFYGGMVEGIDLGRIDVVTFDNEVTERMKNGR